MRERFKLPLENLNLNYENYIVVNTKILYEDTVESSLNILNKLQDNLKKTNTSIMLIGEKNPTKNMQANLCNCKSHNKRIELSCYVIKKFV